MNEKEKQSKQANYNFAGLQNALDRLSARR